MAVRIIALVLLIGFNIFYFFLPKIMWKYFTKKIGQFDERDIPKFVIQIKNLTLYIGLISMFLYFAADEKARSIVGLINTGCYAFGVAEIYTSFSRFKKEQIEKKKKENDIEQEPRKNASN